jgi:hypothetical protein
MIIYRLNAARRQAAFTLVELLVSMFILLMVITTALSSQMYSLRMFEFVKPKVNATDNARHTVGLLMNDVRSAIVVRVGTGSLTSFTEVPPNRPQIGNAIEVYLDADTNRFIRYYRDAADQSLRRISNGDSTMQVIARAVTNDVVFAAEDFLGSTLTNNQNNRVIALTLQFAQLQDYTAAIGRGGLYDFYQLKTKITRRTLL